jgi:hypothetical protein
VSGGRVHAMALRAPWYACERANIERFDDRAAAPAIQKFDSPEFVRRVLADPSASLHFGIRDLWTFPVPRRQGDPGTTFRQRLSPYRQASSTLLKLYQPSHDRFYTVAVELFCDVPGLPRPGPGDEAGVRFVVRRLVTRTGTTDQARAATVTLARLAARELYGTSFPKQGEGRGGIPADPGLETAEDLAGLLGVDDLTEEQRARHKAFEVRHRLLLRRSGLVRELQGWYVGDTGKGGWAPMPAADGPAAKGTEQELPMWRAPGAACPDGGTYFPQRSLWFGAVPTFSGELDAAGLPKLDDRSTYVVQCVARRPRIGCPPLESWSATTRPYRLAGFFDPAGTANHQTHVRLPDLATMAAHTAQDGPVGGVVFTRPARSQLPAGPLGTIPTGPAGSPGGDSAETCTFSIELITIVASFVLALFLPVVVFAFQLWWLLLLKFCWPRSGDAAAVVSALANAPITGLGATGRQLGRMLGVDADVTGALFEPDGAQVKSDQAESFNFVTALAPEDPPQTLPDPPEPPVTDTLCPSPGVRVR